MLSIRSGPERLANSPSPPPPLFFAVAPIAVSAGRGGAAAAEPPIPCRPRAGIRQIPCQACHGSVTGGGGAADATLACPGVPWRP